MGVLPMNDKNVETELQERAKQLLQTIVDRSRNYPSLRGLQRKIEQSFDRLGQPMQIAIVGKIKAGKSTSINALLGESLVASGTVEATFNINWLKYGKARSIVVNFKDDRPPEIKSPQELEALTVRNEVDRDYLLGIKYIEVFHPNPILERFSLIDTPGLGSFFEDDSKNTLEFLNLKGLEGENAAVKTQAGTSHADAILYLFSKSAHESDRDIMAQFQGSNIGRVSPINAIGVLTRADDYWPAEPDPIATGEGIAERLMAEHPILPCLFFKIHPICGLLALGAQTLTETEMMTLRALAALPEARFKKLIRDETRFGSREYAEESDIPIAVDRGRLLGRLGLYGIQSACSLLRSGIDDRGELTRSLLQHSGVASLRELIISHFGGRAFLIKLSNCLQQIEKILFEEQRRQTGEESRVLAEIAGSIDQFKSSALFFYELRILEILRSHYEGKLQLNNDEVEQLLQAAGEKGNSARAKLGLAATASLEEIHDRASQRVRYWLEKANDRFGCSPEDIEAANFLVRVYERLLYEIDGDRVDRTDNRQNNGEPKEKIFNFQLSLIQEQKLLLKYLQQNNIPELLEFGRQLQLSIDSASNNLASISRYEIVLQEIKCYCFTGKQNRDSPQKDLLIAIADLIEKIESNEHSLRELKVFQSYKKGSLDLDAAEERYLLEAVGEKGTSCANRLGLDDRASVSEMLREVESKKCYWLMRANDPFGIDSETLWAANILIGSYERIEFFLKNNR
jgi:hypothetical protein